VSGISVSLAVVAFFGMVFALGWDRARIGQQLAAEAITATATIAAKNERSRYGSLKAGLLEFTPDYFVTYRFAASDGTDRLNEVRVSPTFFVRAVVGATTPVRYLRNDPRQSEVEFGSFEASALGALFGGGMGVLFGLGLAAVALVRPRSLTRGHHPTR